MIMSENEFDLKVLPHLQVHDAGLLDDPQLSAGHDVSHDLSGLVGDADGVGQEPGQKLTPVAGHDAVSTSTIKGFKGAIVLVVRR